MSDYKELLDKVIQQITIDLIWGDVQQEVLDKELNNLQEVKSELERLEDENAKLKEEYLQMKKVLEILRNEGVDIDLVEDCISDYAEKELKATGGTWIMNKKIKDTILESLVDSINEARKFITSYERAIASNNVGVDAGNYTWWCKREENLVEAHKVVSEMEIEENDGR